MAEIIEYPTKEQARATYRQFKAALAKGVLVRATACAWCGRSDLPIQGHHPDYARPLMVVWLCLKCHAAHHRQYRVDRWIWKDEQARARIEVDATTNSGNF